jgi:hypothetical protein
MSVNRFAPIRQGLTAAGISKPAVDNLEKLLAPRGLTVSQLSDPTVAGAGARAFVTDATSLTFNDIAAGGGANRVPVFCTGSDWRVG